MQATIEGLVLTGSGISHAHGEVYELLGLDVIYDINSLKIYSTRRAKIRSISSGIHIHAYYGAIDRLITKGFVSDYGHDMPLEMVDLMGNKVIVTFMGREKANRIAIVTSGGDAPGMNSAIKSIIRTGIKWGASVYGVYKGYGGLINDNIRKLGWDTETYSSSQGGTVLLSARSKRFMEKEGRKQATLNLVRKRINCMVVLGGDGSLDGALRFKKEFREHFRTLISEGKISNEELRKIRSSTARGSSSGTSDRETTTTNGGYSDFYGRAECYKANPTVYHDLNPSGGELEGEDYGPSGVESEPIDVASLKDEDIEQYIYDLKVVGIPATIDNDIYGAAESLGEDTAIHRVIEAIDHLMSTMKSHSRAFVIEVMGRRCGWIALMSAIASAADYVLLPEAPAEWRTEMIDTLRTARKCGKPGVFVILSEGAVDRDGAPIVGDQVVEEISRAGIEVRLLKLGHIQRGGPTSARDRIYGTLLGIKAVEVMLSPLREPIMISIFRGEFKEIGLEEVIDKNKLIKRLQEDRKFDEVMSHRSNFFRLAHSYFRKSIVTEVSATKKGGEGCCDNTRERLGDKVHRVKCKACEKSRETGVEIEPGCPDTKIDDMGFVCRGKPRTAKRGASIGILQCGKRSSGMNTVLNAVVQYALITGAEPYYIPNGFEGLLGDQVTKARLYEFSSDANNGGSAIGVGDCRKVNIAMVQEKIEKFNLKSLIVIGGSDALPIIEKLKNANIVLIPASSFNNVPGMDMSIGVDTALNTILKVSDISKLTSFSCRNHVFVIEIGGEQCGYLSLMGGIAAGAFEVFIPERKYLISHLSETAHRLRVRFRERPRRGIVIFRNETTFCSMPTENFCKVLKTDSEGLFETSFSVLGELQQGANPSPTDRINATILGIKAVDLCYEGCGVGVVGFSKDTTEFTSIEDVLKDFDREHNRSKNPGWLEYSNICRSVE